MNEVDVWASLAAFFVAAASPGPATLAVSTVAMARGARAALWSGLGLSLGLAFWGLVAAAGLGAVLTQSATALFVLRLAGGAYLLYLAWQSARSALASHAGEAPTPAGSGARLFRRGLLLNLTNPKAVLAWMAVLALGMEAGTGTAALFVTTAACALLGGAIYAVYALAFARPAVRAVYRRARRGIEAVVAGFFGYAGFRLVTARSDIP
jgi:threonine/homoserine/homoserine lactone efflux protein